MSARFYAPDARAPGDLVALPPGEAGHLTRVLRLRAGDAVRVFNGRGNEFEAVVVGNREAVRVRVGAARPAAPETPVPLTLAVAVLKADKMDLVIRDAVMMGAASIQPILSTRSETALASIARGRRLERWERVAIASTKQCGRAVLARVHAPCTVDALVSALADPARAGAALMLVEPGAAADAVPLSALPPVLPQAATVVVGPEGGWTAEEIRQGAAACRLVTLRAATVRADAMPTVALAALLAHWRVL